MSSLKQWHALYTRPRGEKKIADRLAQNKIEVYCPLNREGKLWMDRKKNVYQPLFTSYVFVRVSEEEKNLVKKINSDINFVYWLGQPAVIKEEEIEAIKDILEQFKQVKLEKVKVNTNDKVKITNGSLIFKDGNIIEVHSKSVRVYLPSLGYQMIAEIEKSNIEVTKEFEVKHRLVS